MLNKGIGGKFLQVFLKCSVCKNYVPYNSDMCEYCGSVISYDDEERECYISARVCFKCGSENKSDNLYCEKCKSKFTIVCPKCKHEVEEGASHCRKCSFRIDEMYIENEIRRRLSSTKKERSNRIGLYTGGIMSLIATLFFVVLSLNDDKKDIERIGFTIGAAIFCGLFIAVVRNLITIKKNRRMGTGQQVVSK